MPPQHRGNPIPETMETIPGYPETLKLFKIPASRYWQVRAYMGKMVKDSTATESKAEAIKFAKNFYNGLLDKKAKHLPLTQSSTFERVALSLKKEDQFRFERGEISKRWARDQNYIFDADILPFFRDDNIKHVDYQRISDYVTHLKARRLGKPLASSTIKVHLSHLKAVFTHACRFGLIEQPPLFPKIQTVDKPREWFTTDQLATLEKAFQNEIEAGTAIKGVPLAADQNLVLFIATTSFLRPGDIVAIQHKHIEIISSDGFKNLRINAPPSKRHDTPIISLPEAVPAYESLRRLQTRSGFGKPDDFICFPALKRPYALDVLQEILNHVLKKANLKEGEKGTRVLYSLRHTSIMLALNTRSLSICDIARNARTSVYMIERFYGKHKFPDDLEKFQKKKKAKSN